MTGDRRANHTMAADLDHVVAGVSSLWANLRDASLLVTGGTGFFGRWLLASLLYANDRLGLGVTAFVLTRDPDRFVRAAPDLASAPAVSLLVGDMGSFTIPTGRVDFVIHAATETVGSPGTFDPLRKFEADLAGTRRVVALAQEHHARRLLFTSSGAVYGRQPADITHVPETYAGAPDATDLSTAYGQAKRASEFVCAAGSAGSGPEAVIARCFAFVGPHLPLGANYAVGNFLADALAGRPIAIEGDGTPMRSYLYAADLAIWLWTLLLRGKAGRAYNVGSDEAVSIKTLAELVADVVHPGLGVSVARSAPAGTPPQWYVPSIDRARSELGLVPAIPLRAALERTALWYRANGG